MRNKMDGEYWAESYSMEYRSEEEKGSDIKIMSRDKGNSDLSEVKHKSDQEMHLRCMMVPGACDLPQRLACDQITQDGC